MSRESSSVGKDCHEVVAIAESDVAKLQVLQSLTVRFQQLAQSSGRHVAACETDACQCLVGKSVCQDSHAGSVKKVVMPTTEINLEISKRGQKRQQVLKDLAVAGLQVKRG
jgi:hypothetical protein